jgi:hypothetical protein
MALTYPIRPVARPISLFVARLFDVLVATLIFTALT